jgi:hypothetical protein
MTSPEPAADSVPVTTKEEAAVASTPANAAQAPRVKERKIAL